jgi:hypothetical protein
MISPQLWNIIFDSAMLTAPVCVFLVAVSVLMLDSSLYHVRHFEAVGDMVLPAYKLSVMSASSGGRSF